MKQLTNAAFSNQAVHRHSFGVVTVALTLFLALGPSTLAGQRQQNFDTDPNWEGVGNRDAPQDFGFSATSNAGGAAGEMGGSITRAADRAYYADIIERLTLEDSLSCTGRVAITQSADGTAWLFGWFNSAETGWPPANYIGFRSDGNSTENMDLYLRSGNSAGNGVETRAVVAVAADGAAHTFSFSYDPGANNGNGAITFTWDGTHTTTLNLTAEHRAGGATFDRFGLLNLQAPANTAAVFFDELNYTVSPAPVVDRPPQIADLQPADGTDFFDPAAAPSFKVNSVAGVEATGIQLILNGADRTADLIITGDNASRQVRLGGAGLAANTIYAGQIIATDVKTRKTEVAFSFNTFRSDNLTIEAEDYNYEGGKFIDNPVPSDVAGPSSYFDRVGTEGIDYHQVDQAGGHLYRSQDAVGTQVSGDATRQKYRDNFATEIDVSAFGAGEWLNYTRNFPTDAYLVYARVLLGASPLVAPLERVFADSSIPNQTTAALGAFRAVAESQPVYRFVPLTEAAGSNVVVKVAGQRTLRLLVASAGLTVNYLMFVPTADPGVQPPMLGILSPGRGEIRVPPDSAITFTIVNRDTEVVTNTIQLALNDVDVTASAQVTPTLSGASVKYQPVNPLPPNAVNRVRVVFADNATPPNVVSNQWKFTTGAPRRQTVQRQQTFDTDPNWTGVGNRDGGQNFGFADSANAGGTQGEMGGLILRSSGRAFYADDIGILTLEDRLVCTGRVTITQSRGSTAWLFGWFNSTQTGWPPVNYLGFRMNGDSFTDNDIYLRSGNLETLAVSDVPADGTSHTVSLMYDPTANGGNGALTLAWDGVVAGTLNLTAEHRAAGATFDRFGLHNLQVDGQAAEVFFDDLSYTATEQNVQRQQNFDSNPNWDAVANRGGGQDFGFTDTPNAGGRAGEMGGALLRSSSRAYYADNIGTLTLNDRLVCTGLVAITQSAGNSAWLFGWFNSAETGWPPVNYIGFRSDGNPGTMDLYLRSGNSQRNGIEERAVAGVLADGTSHAFSFAYDPASNNGVGAMTFTWDGGPAVIVNLTSEPRDGASIFDRFGLLNLQAGGQTASVFFDNLNYTSGLSAPAPPLRILTTSFAGGVFSLSFATESGNNYTVECKNSLGEASWQALSAITGDGSIKTVTDNTAAGPMRFYRVRR